MDNQEKKNVLTMKLDMKKVVLTTSYFLGLVTLISLIYEKYYLREGSLLWTVFLGTLMFFMLFLNPRSFKASGIKSAIPLLYLILYYFIDAAILHTKYSSEDMGSGLLFVGAALAVIVYAGLTFSVTAILRNV